MQNVLLRFAVMVLAACCILVTGSAGSGNAEETGMYDLTGWNGISWDTDINGEVGHRLFVNSPTARCLPSHNWSFTPVVVSGSLPPGLTLNSAPSSITGIPLERGHWIVRLRMDNVQCEGNYYKGYEQELRFHITGSGKVVQ